MKARILATIRTVGALILILCTLPAHGVRGSVSGADPLPNIWIDLYSLNSTYLGQPVSVGAQIIAFDTQTGVRCGQFIVEYAGYYGIMPCYGDDGVYPGATPGHLLGFTINGATAQTEAVSLNGAAIPATTPVIWDQNLNLWEVNLHARLNVSTHRLESSANPSDLGQSVTFSTEVLGSGPGGETPTGSVQFASDGVVLGMVDLVNGQASLSTADLTAGSHTITATYAGDATFYPSTASLTQIVQYAHLSLTKAVIETSFNAAGVPLHYTLAATNDGNVTLTGVSITDPQLGALTCNPAQPATLASSVTLSCTDTYVTTQADVDTGQVSNTASASGAFEATPVTAAPASATVPAMQNPHLSLTKNATPTSYTTVGQVIHYTLVAINDGNVTLAGVSINDATLGSLTCVQPVTLAPGASLTCTGSHTTTQADLDAGQYDNMASVSGSGPQSQPASATASASVPAVLNPHLTLTKSAAPTSYSIAGEVIHYTLVATNDGGLTLHAVTISDPKLGPLSCSPAQPATLAPGAALACTGHHTITWSDLRAGAYRNTATAAGSDPTGRWVSTTASTTVTWQVAQTPTSTSTKTPTPTKTPTGTPIPTRTPGPTGEIIWLSLSTNATLNNLGAVNDEDIVALDPATGAYAWVFDGSDVGITGDVDAFDTLTNGHILMSFDASTYVPGIGTVADADIIEFTPTSLGATTTGSFAWKFDASDIGLAVNYDDSEDVDALDFMSDGSLLVSTRGAFSVPGVSGADADLLRFTATSWGATTAGAWSLYFDGSDVGLSTPSEDLDGVWLDQTLTPYPCIYLSTNGAFAVTGLAGQNEDIFIFQPTALGSVTAGTFRSPLYLDGSWFGLSSYDIDAFDLQR